MAPTPASTKDYPLQHLAASALAATINYPLWRASAIGQSGYEVASHHMSSSGAIAARFHGIVRSLPKPILHFVYAFQPPYKGMAATVGGMTWARATIFYGSDYGRAYILHRFPEVPNFVASFAPPLVISTFVQVVNMPLVRSTIQLQNPSSTHKNIRESLRHILHEHGWRGLWHGTSAGVLKAVPKYCIAVHVKNVMDDSLPAVPEDSPNYKRDSLLRSACKSVAAGVSGAFLTNPLDVIRNEMFKTNLSLRATFQHLCTSTQCQQGKGNNSGKTIYRYRWMIRGMSQNLIAVSVPVASNIFFTDLLIQYSKST
jgi:hypothetical protein